MGARDTCAPYSSPCPEDNSTAFQQHWPMPPYSESYSACIDPIGATLPKPEWLKPESIVQPAIYVNSMVPTSHWHLLVLLGFCITVIAAAAVRPSKLKGEEDTYKVLSACSDQSIGA